MDQVLVELAHDPLADRGVELLAQHAEEARRGDDRELLEALLPARLGELIGDAPGERFRLEMDVFLAGRIDEAGAAAGIAARRLPAFARDDAAARPRS